MTAITRPRPMRPVDEQLEALGIPKRTRERWGNEISRCTTRYQLALVMESHQIEAYILGSSRRWMH